MPRDPRRVELEDRVRFEHMLAAAREAVKFCQDRSRQDLDDDRLFLRALTHCVQEIGEAASRISEPSRLRAPQIPWSKVVGMRHILVHVYYSIDADTLWRVVQRELPPMITELEGALSRWPATSGA